MSSQKLVHQPVRRIWLILIALFLAATMSTGVHFANTAWAQGGGNISGGNMTIKKTDNATIVNIQLDNGTKITVITGKDGTSHTTVSTADGDSTSVNTDDDGDSTTNENQGDNNNNGE